LTIRSLDGIRGFAVLLVLLSHMSLAGINLFPFMDFSGAGKAGVYLFFALSAFLLTWQALGPSGAAIASGHYWLGYAIRRVCRIYPLYLVVLISAYTLTHFTSGYIAKIETLRTIGMHLVLLEGTHIFWAIPVEFKYYLVLPAVCFALHWTATRNIALSGALTLVLVAAGYFLWPPEQSHPNDIRLSPYLAIFFLGSFAAVACSRYVDFLNHHANWFSLLGWLSIIGGLATVPSVWRLLVDPEASNQVFHQSFLLYAVIWNVAIVAAFSQHSLFSKFFSLAPCRFLGRISFSVYLWHYPILQFINRQLTLEAWAKFILTITLTIALSFLSYRFLERPFIVWAHGRTSNGRN